MKILATLKYLRLPLMKKLTILKDLLLQEVPIKYLRLPLLLAVLLAVLLALWLLWSVQQHNVNSLDQQLDDLQQQIEALPATVAPKDKLALKKDRLILEKDRVNAKNAIYGTLVQALGGVFFAITAYLTYRNVKTAEEKQVTERFSKAIELLGSEKLEVRLGGIYALERIAKDSPKDHWTIMEVLTSFVQEKSPLSHNIQHTEGSTSQNQKNQKITTEDHWTIMEILTSFVQEKFPLSHNIQHTEGSTSQNQKNQKITTEVQAALTVIRRRNFSKEKDWQRIELPSTNLREANFTKASLQEANFDRANLQGANFTKASLQEANFDRANLQGANFTKASLQGADFDEAKLKLANFTEASLQGAHFSRANLQGADFDGAKLQGAKLWQLELNVNFNGANLQGASLDGSDPSRAEGLTPKQISKAIIDDNTKLPDYLRPSKSS